MLHKLHKLNITTNQIFLSVFNFQKYIINAGATPKLIISVKESSSFPTFDVPLINLAILPSNHQLMLQKLLQ
jgi:hypothetical protein